MSSSTRKFLSARRFSGRNSLEKDKMADAELPSELSVSTREFRIPLLTLKQLKCSKYLSQFPTFQQGQQAICGRCEVPEGSIRMSVYESLAKDVSFPCYNAEHGCPEVLIPSNISEHEPKCLYTQYDCPLEFGSTGFCPKASLNTLIIHLEQMHKSQVLYDWNFPLSFSFKYDMKFIMISEGNVFVVSRLWKNDCEYYIGIGLLGPKYLAGKYLFSLELVSKMESEILVFVDVPVYSYNSKHVEEKYFVRVEEKEFMEKFSDLSYILCKIKLINIIKQKTSECERVELVNPDNQYLSQLECPVCMEHMRAPIYFCGGGHSLCGSCKTKISHCPTCRNGMLNARNFHLEKLAEMFLHHCVNRSFGCSKFAFFKQLLEHETRCEFKPYKCPMWEHTQPQCEWKGKATDVFPHVKDKHTEAVIQNDTVCVNIPTVHQNVKTDRRCAIVEKFGKVFRILNYWCNSNFYCCVQFIGPTNDCKRFTYTLDLFDHLKLKRMFFKLVCSPYQGETEANDSFTPISNKMLKAVANDETKLNFRIHFEMEDEMALQ